MVKSLLILKVVLKKSRSTKHTVVDSSGVGEGNLQNKIKEGCTDLLQLCQLTGAGMGCGSCRPEVKALLGKELKPAPKLLVAMSA